MPKADNVSKSRMNRLVIMTSPNWSVERFPRVLVAPAERISVDDWKARPPTASSLPLKKRDLGTSRRQLSGHANTWQYQGAMRVAGKARGSGAEQILRRTAGVWHHRFANEWP